MKEIAVVSAREEWHHPRRRCRQSGGTGMHMKTDIPFKDWTGWNDSRYKPNHFFQSYEWFSVVTATWKDLEIKIRLIDDCLALPVFSRRMGPLVLEGSPLRGYATPYGGFLGEEHQEFKTEYLAGDFNEIILQPNQACSDSGWQQKKTVIIDLRPGADAVWKAMKAETRNQIRKAEKSNVIVVNCSGLDWIEPVYSIYESTFRRQQLPTPSPIELFHQIADQLMQNHLRVYTAIYDGTIVAYAIIGFDSRTAYYIDGGLDRAYGHVCPSNIIQWEVIRWVIAGHFEIYDMNGANIDSIATFKTGFGGSVVPFMAKEYTPSMLGTVAWMGYNIMRPAIKRFAAMSRRNFSSGEVSGTSDTGR
jgi:hypothetical protein